MPFILCLYDAGKLSRYPSKRAMALHLRVRSRPGAIPCEGRHQAILHAPWRAMQSWCEGDDDEASASLCDQAQVDSKLADADLAGCTMPSQRTRIGHRSYRARPPWDRPAAPRIASVRGRARIGYRIAVCRHEGRTPSGPAATPAAMDPRTAFPVGRPA